MRHWLRGGIEDESERIADLMQFGVSEADALAFVDAQTEKRSAVFGVWRDNAEALTVFLRLKRQWRLHPFSGKALGLDHAAIPPTLQMLGIPRKRWPALFDALSLCEEVALERRQ